MKQTWKWGILISILFSLIVGFGIHFATAATSTLRVIGLPPNSYLHLDVQTTNTAGVYVGVNELITNWTTNLQFNVANSVLTTYAGNVPYTTNQSSYIYKGTTYTINETSPLFKNFELTSGITTLPFYAFFNASEWNAQEANELKAIGVSSSSAIIIGLIGNVSSSVQYNGTLVAGQTNNYASYNSNTATVDFVSTNILQNQSYICLNLTSTLGSWSYCKAGTYSFPKAVVNGHFGINGPSSVSITATLTSTLHGSQIVPYTASIKSNGTTLYSASTASSSFSQSRTFTYMAGQSLNITLDGGGNANYSVEDPSLITPPNINYYSQLQIDNKQNIATTANYIQLVQLPNNAVMFGYANSVCNNVEFFNGISGNVLNSWLAGNSLNPYQTTSLCTSGQANTVINLEVPDVINAVSNDLNIYMGWASNTVNLLTSGVGAGEAPQLSCSSPVNTVTGCGSNQYGLYDNGKTVFSDYWNFTGTATPSGWMASCPSCTAPTAIINNGIAITASGSSGNPYFADFAGNYVVANTITDFMGSIYQTSGSSYVIFGPIEGDQTNGFRDAFYSTAAQVLGNVNNWNGNHATGVYVYSNTPEISSVYINGENTSSTFYEGYGNVITVTANVLIPFRVGFYIYTPISPVAYVQYADVRIAPPKGIQPTITFGSVNSIPYTPLANVILSPNSVTIDLGQTITFNVMFTGGTPPYNGFIYQCTTSACTTNTLVQQISGASNSPLTFNPNTITSNTYFMGVIVDSNTPTPTTLNSIAVLATVDPALKANTPTPTKATIDNGQSVILTAQPSGGTPPYTVYAWYTDTSGTCSSLSLISGTTNTVTESPSTNTLYCYKVTDSTFPIADVATSSSPSNIIVNPTFSATINSLPALSTTLEIGNIITLTANAVGGTPPFTYVFQVANEVNNNLLLTQTYSNVGLSTKQWVWTIPSTYTNNVLEFNVIITDNAMLPNSQTSPTIKTLTVLTAPPPALSVSSNPIIYNSIATITYSPPSGSSDLVNLYITNPNGVMNLVSSSNILTTYTFGTSYTDQIGDYVFNAFDTITGVSNIIDPIVYVPVYLQNSIGTASVSGIGFSSSEFYPIQLYTQSPSNTLTYNLTSVKIFSNIIITQNVVLSQNVYCNNFVLNSGVTLTTNGYSIICSNSITIGGTVFTGLSNGGGGAGSGSSSSGGSGGNGGSGANVIASFGGSGGGGGSGGHGGSDGGTPGNGGNGGGTTINGGSGGIGGSSPGSAGSTPASPSVSSSLVKSWLSAGIQNYLEGGTGGGGGGGGGLGAGNGGVGGMGCYGLYLQAENVIITGSINANGIIGNTGSTASSDGGGGGGGGSGGCVILLTYNNTYTAGTYNTLGGAGGVGGQAGGAPGSPGNGGNGAGGGNGNVITFNYGTSPPQSSVIDNIQTVVPLSLNISYIPPSNTPTLTYQYVLNEYQALESVSIPIVFNALNMTDIKSISYLTPLFQYFPNLAIIPNNAFTTTNIISWAITSDATHNQHTNSSANEIFSNANLTFTPKYFLTYSFTSFQANRTNNPAITPLTQNAFKVISTNTIANSPYTREILNISTYDQQSFNPLWANTTFTANGFFNNYSIPINTVFVANNFQVYIPLSTFQNPSLGLSNQTTFSSATSHFTTINNFISTTIINGLYQTYKLYLANVNATLYNFNLYQCNGYANPGYYIVSETGVSASSAFQVQAYQMTQQPFALPLQVGFPYKFLIFTPQGQLVYTSAFTLWTQTSGVTLIISCSNTQPITNLPNVQFLCSIFNQTSPPPYVLCEGNDTNKVINKWNVNITKQISILQRGLVASYTFNGPSFKLNWTIPNTSQQYLITSAGQWGDPTNAIVNSFDVILKFNQVVNPSFFLAGLMLFIGVTVITSFNKVLLILGQIGVLFFGLALGLYNFTESSFFAVVIVSLIVMFIIMERRVT